MAFVDEGVVEQTYGPVGRYALDLLLKDAQGRVVIVENQLEQTDHGHMGQLLTYCAGTQAEIVIWIAHSVRSATHVSTWTWDTYATELRVPSERIKVGRELVEAITAAIEERDLAWQPVMNKGYVAIQGSGGYNVRVVDLYGNRVPRLAAKIPAPPDELSLISPYPNLKEIWTPAEREWGWTIEPGVPLPDINALLDLIQPFHPTSGPMTAPPSHQSPGTSA